MPHSQLATVAPPQPFTTARPPIWTRMQAAEHRPKLFSSLGRLRLPVNASYCVICVFVTLLREVLDHGMVWDLGLSIGGF
jgi:hypothetical protein